MGGYGGVLVANLLACITSPKEFRYTMNQSESENDFWVHEIAKEAVIKVAAWGNHGKFLNRSEKILTSLDQLHCIKMNKSGEPAHLYT